MATTRFYLQNQAPGYTPATVRGTWGHGVPAGNYAIGTSKVGVSAAIGHAGDGAASTSLLIARFVSSALTAAATVDWVQGVVMMRESQSTMDAYPRFHVYVTQGDTDNVRGTIVANQAMGAIELGGTATGMALDTATTTPVAAQAGDRIVIEAGVNHATGTVRTGYVYYGGTSSDLTAGSQTTTLPGWVEFDIVGPAHLEVADASHTHEADSVTLGGVADVQSWPIVPLWAQTLVVADASHTHEADNVVLGGLHTLAVDDAAHTHDADNVVLTQTTGTTQDWPVVLMVAQQTLTVADAAHTHGADAVTLEQHVWYTVNATPNQTLVVADATHTHEADSVALVVGRQLAVDDATHTHDADNVVLTQHQTLAVDDAVHTHTADNVTLATGALTLAIDDAAHTHEADSVALVQAHVLAVNDAAHTHEADNVTIIAYTGSYALVVDDSAHLHMADNVVLAQLHLLAIDDATHLHLSGDLPMFSAPALAGSGASRLAGSGAGRLEGGF